jgi:hypothetical protein
MALPEALWRDVRRLAVDEGLPASALVVEALQMLLKQRREAGSSTKKK